MNKRKRSIDMLSGLPDDVLCHILSFLETKLSVSTSVLAKRWRFLWAHVPNLEFYGYDFKDSSRTQHLEIIIRVVMLHEAKTVDTFNLSLSNVKGCAYQLDTLIIYPIKRNVRNLYLDFRYKYGDEIVCSLPRLLFTCKTLVDLKLSNCGLIPSRGELFLPSLKKLKLRYVQYEDDKSIPHLLSGCPVLEKLIIHDIFREGQKNSGCLIVSSPSIKSLTVNFYRVADPCPDEMLIIDLPALVYLEVYDCHLGHVKSLRKTMTSLILAKLFVNGSSCPCGGYCTEHVRSTEFLSCLCHVEYLKISNIYEDTFVHLVGNGTMPKFVNLTKLKLMVIVELDDLVKFLEVADNLEILIMNLCKTSLCEPRRVPLCMLSRLRTVFLHDSNHCEDDFEDALDMVRYILRNAQVLETMEIFAGYVRWKYKPDVVRRISLFERGSKLCQLAFAP